ncbi:hypothetical protein GQ55_5G448200 [Panicum hallii var. hallii]|uniref:Uncharacterized protein n=1 Tax=Panicum hallii var. hallii TaxID=1504633 RepID=A0A2T7DQ18_9POAL|nr:hypothetical protein GQ55_5G448200 [Panicum hallii var. hallii]
MARKRFKKFVDLDRTEDSYGVGLKDMSVSLSIRESNGFDDSEVSLFFSLYLQFNVQVILKTDFANLFVSQYDELKVLKRKLAKTISLEELKKHNFVRRPKEVFTRFSVSSISSILDALTPDNRKVIDNCGLGSLMLFQKCYAPNKFMKWVAKLVNYRSADIVVDGKVISLTKESIHLLLGLPIGDKAFPSNSAGGKFIIFSIFDKQSIPSVTFFAKKIIKNETKSDKELMTCFILYDWCGYILIWLLDCVKSFNRGKSISSGTGGTFGGCLYYLASLDSIPRISVWKDGMMQTYADFDMKSLGCYGYYPLRDHLRFIYNYLSLSMDPHFTQKLDEFSRCKLPDSLKENICKLIYSYCFNYGVSVNLDVNHISSMPDATKSVFCKLLKHAYAINSRTEKLILDLIKLIANACEDDAY